MDEIIGRTIAAVEDSGYDGFELVFTDGTRAVVVGYGYEDSAAGINAFLDHEGLRRRAAERQGKREADRIRRLAVAASRAEEDAQRVALSPRRFEAWMDANRPGWRTREAWSSIMRGHWEDLASSLNRQFYGDSPPLAALRD